MLGAFFKTAVLFVIASGMAFSAIAQDGTAQNRFGVEMELHSGQAARLTPFIDADYLESAVREGLVAGDPETHPFWKAYTAHNQWLINYFKLTPSENAQLFHHIFGADGHPDILENYLLSPDALASLKSDDPAIYAQVTEGIDFNRPAENREHGHLIAPGAELLRADGKPLSLPEPQNKTGFQPETSRRADAAAAAPEGYERGPGGLFVQKPKEMPKFSHYTEIDSQSVSRWKQINSNWNRLPRETRLRLIRFRNLSSEKLMRIILRLPLKTKSEAALAQFVRFKSDAPSWTHQTTFTLDGTGVGREYELNLEVAAQGTFSNIDDLESYIETVAQAVGVSPAVIREPTRLQVSGLSLHLHVSKVGNPLRPEEFRSIMMRYKRLHMLRLLAAGQTYNRVITPFSKMTDNISLTELGFRQNRYLDAPENHDGLVNIRGRDNHAELKEQWASPRVEAEEITRILALPPDQAVAEVNRLTSELLVRRPDLIATIRQINPLVLVDLDELYPNHELVDEVARTLAGHPELHSFDSVEDPTARWARQLVTLSRLNPTGILDENLERIFLDRLPSAGTVAGRRAILDELAMVMATKHGNDPRDYADLEEGLRTFLLGTPELDDESRIRATDLYARLTRSLPDPRGSQEDLISSLRRQILMGDSAIREISARLIFDHFEGLLVDESTPPHAPLGVSEGSLSTAANILSKSDAAAMTRKLNQIIEPPRGYDPYRDPLMKSVRALLRFAAVKNPALTQVLAENSSRPEFAHTFLGPTTANPAALCDLREFEKAIAPSPNAPGHK